MTTRQPPLDNQVFRVRIKDRTSDKSYEIHTFGPYSKIGAAKAQLKDQLGKARHYSNTPERVTGKIEVIRGEWEEVES